MTKAELDRMIQDEVGKRLEGGPIAPSAAALTSVITEAFQGAVTSQRPKTLLGYALIFALAGIGFERGVVAGRMLGWW